ncbi:MAG: hypothetical protein HQL31_03850 [Planctomycetes bacterium]|nr:hypothetical protein [Planctomycetota bacterium]
MDHPLDIGKFLSSSGVPVAAREDVPAEEKIETSPETAAAINSATPVLTVLTRAEVKIAIRPDFWSKLNNDTRRFLTSRTWKGIDFNPFLENLDDITRLSERWLHWAVPTYVNGLKSGPIRDWIEGRNRDKDFHYILVGEHQKHRNQSKTRAAGSEERDLSGGMSNVCDRLDRHLEWLEDRVLKLGA